MQRKKSHSELVFTKLFVTFLQPLFLRGCYNNFYGRNLLVLITVFVPVQAFPVSSYAFLEAYLRVEHMKGASLE